MTAGELFKEPLLTSQFGESRVWETARKLREIWPGGLPEGTDPINHYPAAYFLYILSSTEGPKDTALALLRSVDYYNSEISGNPITYLGGLLENVDKLKGVETIQISKKTGFVDVKYSGSRSAYFPDLKTREGINNEVIISKWKADEQQLRDHVLEIDSPSTKKILTEQAERLKKRINTAELAYERWKEKYGIDDVDTEIDFMTILKPSFLKEFSKKLKSTD